jgi:hypothetical protein
MNQYMKPNMNIVVMTLALAASVLTTSAQTLLWSDNFDDNNPIGWTKSWTGQMSEANQQFYVWGTFGPTPTNSPIDTFCFGYHSIPTAGPLPDQQTLEARVDLVSANQADASACLQFVWLSGTYPGYALFKEQDNISFVKTWGVGQSNALFFWTNAPVKNANVTLVLSLTRQGSAVRITTRVLDKDNANAVLFERSVVDTPQSDPVLPNRAVNGFLYVPDLVGTPWPVIQAPDTVELGMGWFNPLSASQGAAQVIYDNLEVWQYQTPQLDIQNAIVLSWPVTTGQFILDSAPSLTGPWAPVADPWMRTNNGRFEVSVLASASMQFFRLRLTP